ncbi:hypothetical protein D7V77_36365 [Corallococcus sp. CA041A]|nr:hypothetical protein D7V77_36365 [Corallococcus sp. CA041A]
MRGQWAVVPWWGTSKHVIRKWTWDQIALDTRLQKVMVKASGSLTRASEALSDLIEDNPTKAAEVLA